MLHKPTINTVFFCSVLLFTPEFDSKSYAFSYASAWAQGIEDELEEDVEDSIEEDVEDSIEEDVEDSIDEDVEDSIEEDVEDSIEEDVEDSIEEDVEDSIEEDAEGSIEENVEKTVEGEAKESAEENVEDDEDVEDDIDDIEDDIHRIEDAILENYEHDARGFYRIRDRLIIFTDKKSLAILKSNGYEIDKQTILEGLDSVLAEVIEPENIDLDSIRNAQIKVLSSEIEIDYNHLYHPNISQRRFSISKRNIQVLPANAHPGTLMKIRNATKLSPRIGLIDSAIDASHSVFNTCNIHPKDFVFESSTKPLFAHGTAIASIMCGTGKTYKGLLPKMELFAGSVFYYDTILGEQAAVTSLVLALDWLVKSNVSVINMSLSGPSNRVLHAAINKVVEKGVVVVAAAGNGGPSSEPLYPAAYQEVVAVTAVNADLNAYYLANRGNHIDLSAPGVDIFHAVPGELFSQSSGTSFASPFVSVLIATMSLQEQNSEAVLERILQRAQDLGEPGPDPIYGHGLVRPLH